MTVLINGTTGITTPGLTNEGSQTISTGTANGVTYLNGSKVLTSGSALVFDGTNLGVGTSSPGFKLQVVGSSNMANFAGNDSNNYITVSDNNNTNTVSYGAIGGGNGYLYTGASKYFAFYTGASEKMRLDSSGNLGLGVTPSASWGSGYRAMQLGSLGIAGISIVGNDASLGTNYYLDSSGNTKYAAAGPIALQNMYNGYFRWLVAGSGAANATATLTQAMTLDASNNLLVGTITNTYASRFSVKSNLDNVAAQFYRQGTSSGSAIVIFSSNAGGTETLKSYIDSAGGTLVTTSDENQKENLIEIENAAAKVSTLRSVIGNYIGDKTKHPFLIAQDVQKVLPEAVSITPSGSLGLAYTDTIPLLVAAIKEQQVIITALTARVTALEGN